MMNANIIDIGKDILKQVDIVEIISSFIKVDKKGRNYVALCPFHDDSHPSLSISKEKQIFKCFVCGTSGNAISFVKRYKNCSYFEAVKTVANIAGIHDDRLENRSFKKTINPDVQRVFDCLTKINDYYVGCLFQTEEGQSCALSYLHDRGLTDDIILKFKLGYSLKDAEKLPKNLEENGFSLKTIEKTGIGLVFDNKIKDNNAGRVIFSISNQDGQVVGFSARQLIEDKNQGKYINSPESAGGVFHKSEILYNYFNAKDEARRTKFIYVVEGFMDVIALDRIGIHNVVALMGTAFTKDHLRLLRFLNCEVRLCLDNDNAGQDAMIKISKTLDSSDIKYKLVSNIQKSDGKDCDEILKKSGESGLRSYITNLISEGEFILNYFSKNLDLNLINNKKKVLIEFIPFLSRLENQIDVELYTNKLSSLTGFSSQTIKSQISSYKAKLNNKNNDYVDNSTDADNFEFSKPKRNKVISRLELNERQIVRYMLENKDAIKQYDLQLGYLINDDYRKIANLIEQYSESQNSEEYSVSNLIEYINAYNSEVSDAEKNELIDKITWISMSDYKCPPYNKESFDECVKIINEKKEWDRSSEAYKEGSLGKTIDEKAQQAKALLQKRRELILQKDKENR